MRIGLFLPHVGVFGGVRRYLELGNEWAAMGHDVTLHHPDGTPPTWLAFHGATAPLARAAETSSDLAICGDAASYGAFREALCANATSRPASAARTRAAW